MKKALKLTKYDREVIVALASGSYLGDPSGEPVMRALRKLAIYHELGFQAS